MLLARHSASNYARGNQTTFGINRGGRKRYC
jgi:hypothetical protein